MKGLRDALRRLQGSMVGKRCLFRGVGGKVAGENVLFYTIIEKKLHF